MTGAKVFFTLGTLCILYFIMYAVTVDLTNKSVFLWLVLGFLFGGCGGVSLWMTKKEYHLPTVVSRILTGGVIVFSLCFVTILGILIFHAFQKPDKEADYMIVLGARVRGDKLSSLLQYRLDTAYDYIKSHPKLKKIVVTGGQGPGENITEAKAMYDYLVAKGVDSEKIIMEAEALNTDENIRNSLIKLGEYEKTEEVLTNASTEKRNLLIVSNGFHLYRAKGILRKQLKDLQKEGKGFSGDNEIEGLGAWTRWYVAPHSYVREVFGVVKYKLCGQM